MKSLQRFNFKELFVLDLANNHQGSVTHGSMIINECGKVIRETGVRAAIKFQFRNLPEFVHISHREKSQNKHVSRFMSTSLNWEDFKNLRETVKRNELLAMCTPFDETSVDRILEIGFDIIKVASCSAKDWPLLERIAASGLPVIASTGGLEEREVDDLVSFLTHRGCDFALMHCVSIYPTPDDVCHLNNIRGFKERYPDKAVGWSTHEPPNDTIQVTIAAALGAEIFERHVGLETDSVQLNAYSSTPAQIEKWIETYKRGKKLMGGIRRGIPTKEELVSVQELSRGVFFKRNMDQDSTLTLDDVYFAFPFESGQLTSGSWQEGITLKTYCEQHRPVTLDGIELNQEDERSKILKTAIHEVKALLAYAHVVLSHEFTTEYSHHYGVENFRRVGVVLITVINRQYAKKILVQLSGQVHPMHYHKLKEETFCILFGELIGELDGRDYILRPGDTLTVPPGVWHSFRTETGCVFEEISTTAFSNDSVYRDPEINKLSSEQRKTKVDHWGRFQLNTLIDSGS